MLAGVLWLVLVTTGLGVLAQYDGAPGAAAQAPPEWPAATALRLDGTRPTLVMLLHPRCSCSRASIAELAELMAQAEQSPRLYIVFIKPGGTPAHWEDTDLWRAATGIAGATIVTDAEGVEAARFGAETSGQTFLYDASGRLLFSGGTTGARGHRGDNAGRASILALLNEQRPARASWYVFGCSLFAPADRPAAMDAESDARDPN